MVTASSFYFKIHFGVGGVPQVGKRLPSKHKALSIAKKKIILFCK
jgi:hypothetical protein